MGTFPLGPSKEFNYSFDPGWIALIEFYCPQCATLVETEYLPLGHPLTWDMQNDIETLRRKYNFKSGASSSPTGAG